MNIFNKLAAILIASTAGFLPGSLVAQSLAPEMPVPGPYQIMNRDLQPKVQNPRWMTEQPVPYWMANPQQPAAPALNGPGGDPSGTGAGSGSGQTYAPAMQQAPPGVQFVPGWGWMRVGNNNPNQNDSAMPQAPQRFNNGTAYQDPRPGWGSNGQGYGQYFGPAPAPYPQPYNPAGPWGAPAPGSSGSWGGYNQPAPNYAIQPRYGAPNQPQR